MYKAYKFRLYPNSYQKQLLSKTFGCVRLSIITFWINVGKQFYQGF